MTPHSFQYQVGRGPYLESAKAAAHIFVSIPMFTLRLPFYVLQRYHSIYKEMGMQPRPFREGIQLTLIALGAWIVICAVLPTIGLCGYLRVSK